jgi:hypothetical protein
MCRIGCFPALVGKNLYGTPPSATDDARTRGQFACFSATGSNSSELGDDLRRQDLPERFAYRDIACVCQTSS